MLFTQLLAEPISGKVDQLEKAVEGYLGAAHNNGQVLGQPIIGRVNGAVHAAFYVASRDALESKYNSTWGNTEWQKLDELATGPPTIAVLDDRDRRTEWKNAGCLYLFTHMLDVTSPVCAGDDGTPIPLYRLPITSLEREEIVRWATSYRNHDELAIDCRDLEIPAYKQLADPTSGLSRRGREICHFVEEKTSLPTYYYMHRYWGRRVGEEDRLCPSCGGQWKQKAGDNRGIGWFDFKCDACRIVSRVSPTDDDERHARIGEFRPAR